MGKIFKRIMLFLAPTIIIVLFVISFFVALMKISASADGTGFNDGLVGDTIEEKLWWAMHDAGFDDVRTASLMGNIYQESRFDYKSHADNGLGLCGWLYAYLGDNLVDYAKSKGEDWPSENTQIEFIIAWHARQGPAVEYVNDSEGPVRGMGFEYFGVYYDEGAWLDYKLTSDTDEDIRYCTLAYCANYERCGEWEIRDDVRIGAAKDYYKQFHGKSRPKSKGGSEKGSDTPGIKGVYTSSSGKKYTEYWQNIQGTPWYWDCGCFHCSLATIMSGFGSTDTPNQLTGWLVIGYQTDIARVGGSYEEISASQIKAALKTGDPVMFGVFRWNSYYR